MSRPIDLNEVTRAYAAGLVSAQDVACVLAAKLPSGAPDELLNRISAIGKWDSDELSAIIYEIEVTGYRVLTDSESGL
jgi:hypothetical protein